MRLICAHPLSVSCGGTDQEIGVRFSDTLPGLFSPPRSENPSSIDPLIDSYKLGCANQRHWLSLPWIIPTNASCKRLNTHMHTSLTVSLLNPNVTVIFHNRLKKKRRNFLIRRYNSFVTLWVTLILYLYSLVLALRLHTHTQRTTHKMHNYGRGNSLQRIQIINSGSSPESGFSRVLIS